LLQQLLVDYQNTVLKAQQEVDDGLATYSQSRLQTAFLYRGVEAAIAALRIGTEQYGQGATSFIILLTAEQNLLQAQNSLDISLRLLTAIFRAPAADGRYVRTAIS
jgi:outer membrane protein TolC